MSSAVFSSCSGVESGPACGNMTPVISGRLPGFRFGRESEGRHRSPTAFRAGTVDRCGPHPSRAFYREQRLSGLRSARPASRRRSAPPSWTVRFRFLGRSPRGRVRSRLLEQSPVAFDMTPNVEAMSRRHAGVRGLQCTAGRPAPSPS